MIIDTMALEGEHTLQFLDQSRHYFGGYFHVKVLVYCDVPVRMEYFATVAEGDAVVAAVGETVRFERVLEKMAVPQSDMETVRDQLIQTFRTTTGLYLSVADFASRFVMSEYQRRLKKTGKLPGRY